MTHDAQELLSHPQSFLYSGPQRARPGCVRNAVIRGLFVEIGDRAFTDLMTEWFVPFHALNQKFRYAGLLHVWTGRLALEGG